MGTGKAYRLKKTAAAGGAPVTVTISGSLSINSVRAFLAEAESLLDATSPSTLTVDVTDLKSVDSAGALALLELEERARKGSLPLAITGMNHEVRGVMDLIDRKALAHPPIHPEKTVSSFFEGVGEGCVDLYRDFVAVMVFLGDLIIVLGRSLVHPRSVRWSEVTFYMKKAGIEALPIVGLISVLIGLIIAFMSSLQLKQFGANMYVAALVGISIVKELGPMMTAIIVAGRSGSAFAAEIGTMMVNEEVDALVTMGFNPIQFLAVPKVMAAMVVVPLLTLYAMMFGIFGGLVVGVTGLDLTLYTYLNQTFENIHLRDLITSLIKSGVFAALIAGIGCQRGFQVSGGAEAVGEATTSAVVSAIFLIVAADSAFAVVLHYL
ncbi:MAG: ABC transporter permease [Syntrophaceae bacterium]|nr:ABC transporter permease [Syntrophaceae bacterium]